MMSQMSLLYISLAPVVAYILGALVFSLVDLVHKTPMCSRQSIHANYRNGL
jgi:hypothetical protein